MSHTILVAVAAPTHTDLARAHRAKVRATAAGRRKLKYQPAVPTVIERAEIEDHAVVMTFDRAEVGYRAFGKTAGALIERTYSEEAGEQIKIYNPVACMWEQMPLRMFESSYVKVPSKVAIGRCAIVQNVTHSTSGFDYGTKWDGAKVAVALRLIRRK